MARVRLWISAAFLILPALFVGATTGIFREQAIPGPPGGATAVVGGPDDGFWFTEFDRNRVGTFSRDGQYRQFAVPTPDSGPYGIASDSRAIWFTEFKAGKIGKLTLDGVFTEYVVPSPQSAPWGIASIEGAAWFTESVGNKIGRVNSDGSVTEFTIPTRNAVPRGIAGYSSDRVCFAEFGADQIGCLENGLIVERGLSPGSGPDGVAVPTTLGDVWFTESTGNRIGIVRFAGVSSLAQARIEEFAIPTPASGPAGLVADFFERSAWFTEKSGGQIGFISPDGRITEYPLADRSSQPTGICFSYFLGPEMQVRFLESAGNRLVEIRPDAVLVAGAGVSGTWQTEFHFANLESGLATVFAGIFPRPEAQCGICTVPQLLRQIPANGSTTAGTDVLQLRGLETVSVRVLEDGVLPSVRARVFSVSAPSQSLDLPTIRFSRLTELNPAFLSFPGAVKGSAARSNLWLAEVSMREPLDVVIELIDPNGTLMVSREETLGAGQTVYLVDVITSLGIASFPDGQLRVRKIGDQGLLWGYLATVNSDGAISIFSGLNP